MKKRSICSISLLFILCFVFLIPAGSAAVQKPTPNTSAVGDPSICNQPYGLCDFSKCTPMKSDPTKVLCGCSIENGVSAGQTSCETRKPVGITYDKKNGWMLEKGALFGQLTSTYSFVHAAPVPGNLINPNVTPIGYTGSWYLKKCTGTVWADCEDKPCFIPPANPLNDTPDKSRSSANYAVCQCDIVKNSPTYYMVCQSEEQCNSPTICTDYIWSAGAEKKMEPGLLSLAKYLSVNPDPSQPYAMDYDPNCKDCPPDLLTVINASKTKK